VFLTSDVGTDSNALRQMVQFMAQHTVMVIMELMQVGPDGNRGSL